MRIIFTIVAGVLAFGMAGAEAAPKKAVRRVTPPASTDRAMCMPGPDVETIRAMVRAEAARQGADVKLALAIAEAESASGVFIRSDEGALGPMQILPATAEQYGVTDICDPAQNIRGGVAYLKDLMKEFQGNIMLVAAAYNAGPERVYDAKGVPPIAETVRFVAAVTNEYSGFGTHVSRKGRGAGSGMKTASAPAAPAGSAVDSAAQAAVQNWIGGSVLYVEGEEGGSNDEQKK